MPNKEAQIKGSAEHDGAVKNLRDNHIDRQLAALNQRFASVALDDAAALDLLKNEHARLNQLKQQPLTPRQPKTPVNPQSA